eukprot:14771874-Alexandrium_andersonii.AAC.1
MRDHSAAPSVHFYSAGFPCTPYSGQGQHGGLESSAGQVGLHCLLYLAAQKPTCFILENVSTITSTRHYNDFKTIMNFLSGVRNADGSATYPLLTFKSMSSDDYGVPQHRPRIYIIGMKKMLKSRPFKFPPKQPLALGSFDNLLEPDHPDPAEVPSNGTEQRNYLLAVEHILKQKKALTDPFVVDLGAGFKTNGKHKANVAFNRAPCITKARAMANAYYCFARSRKLTTTEYFRLQSFPDNRIEIPPGISERQ